MASKHVRDTIKAAEVIIDKAEQISGSNANKVAKIIQKAEEIIELHGEEEECPEEPEIPEPGEGDEFEGVFVVDGNNASDVQGWPITAEVTGVDIKPDNLCLFSKLGNEWPDGDPGINGNPWCLWERGGVWYGATYEWLRSSEGGMATQECKKMGADGSVGNTVADQLAPHMKSPNSEGWVPALGEETYFFVASLSRLGDRTVNERSQIVKVIWPF